MELYLKIIIGLLWLISGILDYGFLFAYYQKEYPELAKRSYTFDFAWALFGLIVGPIGLMATLLTRQYKHGLKFK